jgi:hypothetical protein
VSDPCDSISDKSVTIDKKNTFLLQFQLPTAVFIRYLELNDCDYIFGKRLETATESDFVLSHIWRLQRDEIGRIEESVLNESLSSELPGLHSSPLLDSIDVFVPELYVIRLASIL